MVTRSIVGRFLIMAVLLVSLGVIAQAALIISKGSGKTVAKGDTAAGQIAVAAVTPAAAATPAPAIAPPVPASVPSVPQASAGSPAASGAQQGLTADAAPVRVVYPGPLGDAPVQARKITDPAPASPLAAPAPVQAVTPASSAPVAAAMPAAPASAAPATAAVTPAPAAPVVVASADADAQPTAADPAAPPKGSVNLNSASVDALNHIGGGHIGQSIVQHRPYRSVEDLVKKRVVRRSVYEQIKDQVAAE